MTVETEPAPHEGVEVLGEEVGEIEGAELLVVQRLEPLGSGEHLVAVRAREPLHAGNSPSSASSPPPVPQSA